MIPRAYVSIDGPPGAGKTTLIERLLRGNRSMLLAAAHCEVIDQGGESREIQRGDDTVDRFLTAGAAEASAFRFAPDDARRWEDLFWSSELMTTYFHGLLIENPGSLDLAFVHRVFVLEPPGAGDDLLERGPLRLPSRLISAGLSAFFPGIGIAEVDRAFRRPAGRSRSRSRKRGDHWRLTDRYAGLAEADTILLNTPAGVGSRRIEQTRRELCRVLEEPEIAGDVFKWRGTHRRPHLKTGDLLARGQREVSQALGRIRAAIRSGSEYLPELE